MTGCYKCCLRCLTRFACAAHTIEPMHLSDFMVKPLLSAVCWPLLWAPAVSTAEDARVPPLRWAAPDAVLPSAALLGEPRGAIRLREVLRQPYSTEADDNMRYHMPRQERQRLREQLRSQALENPIKN